MEKDNNYTHLQAIGYKEIIELKRLKNLQNVIICFFVFATCTINREIRESVL